MLEKEVVPAKIKAAARKFRSKRADYYEYLADLIEGSQGTIKFQQIFERDTERYANKPRGTLSNYWANTFSENGASLSQTWAMQFPDDELALINVSQQAGDGALIRTLRDVAVSARLKMQIASKVRASTLLAGSGFLIAFLMACVYPIYISELLKKSFSMIPDEFLQPLAKSWYSYAGKMEIALPYIVITVIVLAILAKYSINNLIGRPRNFLDDNFFIYKTIRDIKAIMFLTSLSTITKERGSERLTLKKALAMFEESSRSKWFSWRIKEIIENIESSGALTSDVFKTPILSEEVYFYLRDMQESRGITEGFNQTSNFVKNKLLQDVSKKLTIYSYTLLAISAAVVISVTLTQTAVVKSMTNGMKIYYTTR